MATPTDLALLRLKQIIGNKKRRHRAYFSR